MSDAILNDPEWVRFVAKFQINDLRGMLHKHAPAKAPPPEQVGVVLFLIYRNFITRAVGKSIISRMILYRENADVAARAVLSR